MKYYGKEKCRILKEIRAEIAKANDIEWVVSECKHKGNCKGTCPKCEQEVRELEAALARREALGKTVAVVGISASIVLSVTGCVDLFTDPTAGVQPLQGGKQDLETTAEPPDGTLPYETEMGETEPAIPGEPAESQTETETADETSTREPVDGEMVFAGVPLE